MAFSPLMKSSNIFPSFSVHFQICVFVSYYAKTLELQQFVVFMIRLVQYYYNIWDLNGFVLEFWLIMIQVLWVDNFDCFNFPKTKFESYKNNAHHILVSHFDMIFNCTDNWKICMELQKNLPCLLRLYHNKIRGLIKKNEWLVHLCSSVLWFWSQSSRFKEQLFLRQTSLIVSTLLSIDPNPILSPQSFGGGVCKYNGNWLCDSSNFFWHTRKFI